MQKVLSYIVTSMEANKLRKRREVLNGQLPTQERQELHDLEINLCRMRKELLQSAAGTRN